ncbi:uncharacterized protein Z520_10368 [Fonsecaea multimorphosa CBS 102226]|uniref:Major facilitator superfamily (MFS) profile domain-containing protein n=1 Tax=Fonsecaea multimorphosa CBS 102226 TaxID=1442371 RepID=A0A0D2IA52_9EURO|nr:uncharacterized protein Z520_10368 [Fonsecaea multimorphosa CBS 102226]KIX94031.1 hypothetical protein Z520_10368 [Fonsecaea multimorphosa CBS 102226]OAL19377.1 hypothetical protein AYO22_09921 [Fonsecaea multimorphosa]
MPSPPLNNPDDPARQDVEGHNSRFSDVSLALDGATSSTEYFEKSEGKTDLLENAPASPSTKHPARPSLAPGISSTARRPSFIDEEEEPIATTAAANGRPDKADEEAPVTWMSLPKKGQLAVLTFARLSEPLTERSLAAYLFYQLRYFDPDLPDSTIASQGGMLTASFAAAQFLTAVWWGRAADTPWIGRKRVLLVGLFGTCISCIGVGFSKSFAQALFFRACAGCLNGNVGVMRTMISEIIKEKKYQSRAFLLLPMCFNIGVVIGPILGGFLADPISSFPSVFGPGSLIGGKDGVGWMTAFPYALPNVVSSMFILASALLLVLGLDETHVALKDRPDYGRRLGKYLVRVLFRRGRQEYEYSELGNQVELQDIDEDDQTTQDRDPESSRTPAATPTATKPASWKPNLSFRQIFTKNVILTLLNHHLLAMHVSAFNALVFLFLPAPRSNNAHARLPFLFTGGLGLSSDRVGLATAIIGIIGFPLQILLYPSLNSKLGTLPSYRWFLPFSILAYATMPYLSLIPNKAYLVWPALTVVLAFQVIARTFALPGSTILINNCTPHPSVLGTIHGFAQSISSGARTLGPTLGGWGLGMGLGGNCVGAVWWVMAGIAVANWSLLWVISEGDAGAAAAAAMGG